MTDTPLPSRAPMGIPGGTWTRMVAAAHDDQAVYVTDAYRRQATAYVTARLRAALGVLEAEHFALEPPRPDEVEEFDTGTYANPQRTVLAHRPAERVEIYEPRYEAARRELAYHADPDLDPCKRTSTDHLCDVALVLNLTPTQKGPAS